MKLYRIVSEKCISPSLVKQYIYCPVIPWIMSTYNLVEPVTDSMRLGREKHEGKPCTMVIDPSNNAVAVVDEVRTDGNVHVIVEYKAYPTRSIHRYVEQLKTQAYIVKRRYKHVRKAVLDIDGYGRIVLEITETMLKDAEMLLHKVATVISSEKPPPPTTNTRYCRICWYRKFCPYT